LRAPPGHAVGTPPAHAVTKRPRSSGWQNKNNYLVRLRRVEEQIRGLQRMVEDDKASFVLSHLGSVPDGAR
jgi:hypothetical protein